MGGVAYGDPQMTTPFLTALCRRQGLQRSVDHDNPRPVICKIVINSDGPPEWVMLVPGGDTIKARDGRKFSNSKPNDVVAVFGDNEADIPIDLEHATEVKAPEAEPAPAVGWVVAMEVRDGAIWGQVEWTEEGAWLLRSRQYRFLSPAFLHDEDGLVIEILSAGLTNRPALKLPELAQHQGERTMDKKLLELLGLDENATPQQVAEAVRAMKQKGQEQVEALEAKDQELATARQEAEAQGKKLQETEQQLATARAQVPGLDKFVPRADYDALKGEVSKLQEQVQAQTTSTLNQEIDREIDQALKAGKITPATKDYHLASCKQEGGLERFREFVKTAPVVGQPATSFDDPPPSSGGGKGATPEDLAIARVAGITEEQFKAAL